MAGQLKYFPNLRSENALPHERHASGTCPYCCHPLEAVSGDSPPPSGVRLLGQPDSVPPPGVQRRVCQRCRLLFDGEPSIPELTEDDRQRVMVASYRARRAHDRFRLGREERFRAVSELAEAFVCLQGARGVRPFSATEFHDWASNQVLPDSTCAAVAFVLHVADARTHWKFRFEIGSAMRHWDTAQRAVFVEWARLPWWA
jgi:hypothetical protein